MSTRGTGARGEDAALAHLTRAGLALLVRNYSCRYGELDLVMRERDTFVFVEVRYRSGAGRRGGYGCGAESIGAAKRSRLVRAAGMFLADHPRPAQSACRFDVVALDCDDDATIDWRRNAFETN